MAGILLTTRVALFLTDFRPIWKTPAECIKKALLPETTKIY